LHDRKTHVAVGGDRLESEALVEAHRGDVLGIDLEADLGDAVGSQARHHRLEHPRAEPRASAALVDHESVNHRAPRRFGQPQGADELAGIETDESLFAGVVAEILTDDRDHGVVICLGGGADLQGRIRPGARRRRGAERGDHTTLGGFESCAEALHPGERDRCRVLADDQDALPLQARGRAAKLREQRGGDAATLPGGVHHAACLGFITRGQTGVPDHLVGGGGKKVNRAIEVVGLIKLDLEVEVLRCLAGPPEPVDLGSVRATQVAVPKDPPSTHRLKPDMAARRPKRPPRGATCRFGRSPFVVIIGATYPKSRSWIHEVRAAVDQERGDSPRRRDPRDQARGY